MSVDFKSVLENMGYVLTDHSDHWRTSALYRSGDNPTALQIYKDSGIWKDFVEDSKYLPFELLIKKTLKTSDNNLISGIIKDNYSSGFSVRNEKNFLKEEKTYKESCLKKLLPHFDFYLNKNISEQTLLDFKCGLATSGKLYKRVVFPIFRGDGLIHGFSGRKVTNDDRPKWLHKGKTTNWFYPYFGINEVKNQIDLKQQVHIVESIGDCMALYNKGIKNVLVSFGLNMSPKFIARLSALNLQNVYISYNNDSKSDRNRGFEGAVKSIFKLIDAIDFKKIYFCPPDTNDFGDMTEQQINHYEDQCFSADHQICMHKVISIAERMDKVGVNKSFSLSLKKLKDKYQFYYGDQ
jgi:hypothetical protein